MAKDASRIELLQGTLDLLILRTLIFGPSHGHAIAQRIRAVSDDVLRVETGSLYPGAASTRGAGPDRGVVGAVGQGQAGEVLRAHAERPQAADAPVSRSGSSSRRRSARCSPRSRRRAWHRRLIDRLRTWWPWRGSRRRARRGDRLPPRRGSRRAARRRARRRRRPRRGAPRLRQRRHRPRRHARGVGLGAGRAAHPGRPLRRAGVHGRPHRLDRRRPDAGAGDRRQHRDLLDRQRPAAPAAAGRRAGAARAALGDGRRRSTRSHWSNPIWEQLARPARCSTARFAWACSASTWRRPARATWSYGLWASGRMFEVLGVQAVVGRTLTADDDRRARRARRPVAVHQLRLLAAAVRRIAGRRSAAASRSSACRSRSSASRRRLLRRRSRPHLRRRHPDRARRRSSGAPSALDRRIDLVAARDVPPEARADAGRGERALARAQPQPSARRRSPTEWHARRATCAKGSRVAPAPTGAVRRCAASTQRPLTILMGVVVRRAADRLRQPRQPAAGAGRGATAGAEPAPRARRLARPHRAAAAAREPAARRRRRVRRPDRRALRAARRWSMPSSTHQHHRAPRPVGLDWRSLGFTAAVGDR